VSDPSQITTLLAAWRGGNQAAADELVTIIYPELRRLAAHYLKSERADHTLQPTALVHELYVRLFTAGPITWQNRAHFFVMAARAIRNILVDHARRRSAEKRGGRQVKLSLNAANGWAQTSDEDILDLQDHLKRLEELEPRAAQVVELRFFGGLNEDEVAEALDVSRATVKREMEVCARLAAEPAPAIARRNCVIFVAAPTKLSDSDGAGYPSDYSGREVEPPTEETRLIF
jgi:RNA polymerase sigma factor (TIGR02999 family)